MPKRVGIFSGVSWCPPRNMLKLLRAAARPERAMEQVHCGNAADTLRLGAGMGARLWPGGDMALNAEFVVAKPSLPSLKRAESCRLHATRSAGSSTESTPILFVI